MSTRYGLLSDFQTISTWQVVGKQVSNINITYLVGLYY